MANFYPSRVTESKKLNDKYYHVCFELQGDQFSLESGQFIVMQVSPGIFRSYSIASLPTKIPQWEVVVDTTPGGPGSLYIGSLKEGDIIQTTNPRGIFKLQDDSSDNIILVATGCGIAPIKPMVEELLTAQFKGKITLLWGMRFEEDLFFISLLKNWKENNPNFNFEIILSKPGESWKGKAGHVTEHLESLLQQTQGSSSLYLCGSSEMVGDVLSSCERLSFPSDRIYFEKYA